MAVKEGLGESGLVLRRMQAATDVVDMWDLSLSRAARPLQSWPMMTIGWEVYVRVIFAGNTKAPRRIANEDPDWSRFAHSCGYNFCYILLQRRQSQLNMISVVFILDITAFSKHKAVNLLIK